MTFSAFTAPGRFHKGNLHTHSNASDGGLDPAEVCRRYRERGYDFLCLSDHFLERFGFPIVDTRPFRADGFTTLIGAELHAPATESGELWHILAVGLPFDFAPTGAAETGPQLADRAYEAGAFVAIPHPDWYGLSTADGLSIARAHAVEVHNHTAETLCSRPGGSYFLDALLNAGRRIGALAADDAHFNIEIDRDRDAFGGWVMVKAEENGPEALLAALKAGNYYATRGPDFVDIRRDGDELVVLSSPVDEIIVLGPYARCSHASGLGRTEARFDLSPFAGGWCRVTLRDGNGMTAWSNPFWLD